MSKENLIIVGTGLSAKQVYDFVKIHDLFNIIGFAVDSKYMTETSFLGLPILRLDNIKEEIDMSRTKIFVSLGWNYLNSQRKELYTRLKEEGYLFANLISPLAVIRGTVDGDNCWINDYSVMQSDSIIKSNVIMREGVIIGNGTIVKEHVFVGVNGVIGGNAVIGEQTFIGIRGTVFDGTKVGRKCLIGACAVVKRHLANFCVCKTSTDAMIVKQYSEDEIEKKLIAGKGVR